jgi:hypothetical protein
VPEQVAAAVSHLQKVGAGPDAEEQGEGGGHTPVLGALLATPQ